METIIFDFDINKNSKLKLERGIGFEEVIYCIHNDKILDIRPHPNQKKYSNQSIYIIEINDYAYIVPFIQKGHTIFLKTIFPSRKATKLYLKTNEDRYHE